MLDENEVTIDIPPDDELDSGTSDDESLPTPEFEYDDDDPNLAMVFAQHPEGREFARKIVSAAKTDFENDWEALANNRKQAADNMKLFRGDLPAKTWPYKNSANPHVPIMMENLSRLQMRIIGELFGDWTNVFGVVPVGMQDEQTSDILTKHGNWQLREQLTDFKRQMSKAVLLFLTNGDVSSRSYYDPIRNRNCHEVMTGDRFVVPYGTTSMEPDYSDLPHYAMILSYHRHEISKMRGIWFDVDKVLKNKPSDIDDDPDAPMMESVSESKKQDKPMTSRHRTYKIIQYEGWFSPEEFPNQTEDRFVKVVFDYHSETLLHLSILEEDDWQESLRYKQQLLELQQYREAYEAYEQQVDQAQERYESNQGLASAETAGLWDKGVASAEMSEENQQPPIEAPVPPNWMEDPTDPDEMPRQPRKRPIHLFGHGVCIEPLEGPMGVGYGQMLADMNRAANTALSQYSDAATANNVWSIVTPSGWVVNGGGQVEISPGKHNKIEGVSPKELRDGLVELKPGPASPQLLDIVKFMIEYGQSATQAPDILSGEAGKSGETYRGLDARIEQATKQLTVITRAFADMVTQLLKNNAKLNSMFLPDEEMVAITDPITRMQSPIPVRREMYARSYQIEFRSDMRFTSQQQRIDEGNQVLAMYSNFQFLAQDVAFAYKAMVDVLKAYNRSEYIPMLGPAPNAPATTFGLMPNGLNGVGGQPPMLPPPQGAPPQGQGQQQQGAPAPQQGNQNGK